jgi:hypothetical protein
MLLFWRMNVMNRLATSLIALSALSTAAEAQPRLFARSGDAVLEIGTTGASLGRITRQYALPACGGTGPMRPVNHGRYLAWTRPGGLCLLSVLDGQLRSIEVPVASPSDQPLLAAASEDQFVVVVTAGDVGPVFVLTDPGGPLRSVTLPGLPGYRHFGFGPAANMLVVVFADWGNPFGGPRPSATVLRIDLATVTVQSTALVPLPLFVNGIAVDRAATRVAISSADMNAGVRGLFVVDASTGGVLTSNTSITPRYVSDYRTTGTPMLMLDEADGVLGVVTYDGLRFLDTASLAPIGGLNLPRGVLPIVPPNDSRTLGYALFFDDSTRSLLALENEGQLHSYHGGPCLRSTLSVVPVDGGPTRSADLVAIYGQPLCGSEHNVFMIPAPPRPNLRATVTRPSGQPTGVVELAWTTSPATITYVLEAGSTPGSANLLRQTVTGTTLSVDNVPPGTYYVRLRAVGVAGDAISSELLVRL